MNREEKAEKLQNIIFSMQDIEVELFDRAGNDFDEILAQQLKSARKQLEDLMKGELYA
tara:strand:- start:391 stop:564 length:174 start_codon:yes stop_codon:yes gene_type:complete